MAQPYVLMSLARGMRANFLAEEVALRTPTTGGESHGQTRKERQRRGPDRPPTTATTATTAFSPTVNDPAALLRHMVDDLDKAGYVSPDWRTAFLAVPRHQFIPDTVWIRDSRIPGDYDLLPVHRSTEPQRWLTLAYGDDSVITQVDDGISSRPDQRGRAVSSSASQPRVVAMMLDATQLADGMTVCEIGTGTGYNAALLTERLGADNVTTIEVDSAVAQHARQAMHRAGYRPTTVTDDGALGYQHNAPYDRILATCAVYHIPYPWVAQTQPDGRIITPWGTPYHNGGLLALTVDNDGTAHGSLIGTSAFMWLRAQRIPRTSIRESVYNEHEARISHTALHPAHVVSNHDAATTIGLRVPHCKTIYSTASDDSGEFTLWLIDQTSRSWASVDYAPDASIYEVNQLGPRNLWDEVEAAYSWWCEHDQPSASDWQFIIGPNGQRITT